MKRCFSEDIKEEKKEKEICVSYRALTQKWGIFNIHPCLFPIHGINGRPKNSLWTATWIEARSLIKVSRFNYCLWVEKNPHACSLLLLESCNMVGSNKRSFLVLPVELSQLSTTYLTFPFPWLLLSASLLTKRGCSSRGEEKSWRTIRCDVLALKESLKKDGNWLLVIQWVIMALN